MRTIITCLLSLLTFSSNAQPRELQGTWIPSRQEMGGKALPPAAFERQRLILADSTYTTIAESVDKGIVKYNGDKMDIYGREGVNAGKHFTAIYKCNVEELIICYNLKGDSYPTSFTTSGDPLLFVSVFKKQPGVRHYRNKAKE